MFEFPNFEKTEIAGTTFINADCFDVFPFIPDNSIDAIICDLPYGITKCDWDKVLPLDSLWKEYKRIIKSNGAIVLFGMEPFSSMLRMSNLSWYKYDWVWVKEQGTDFLNAKKRPLNNIENISVFYQKQCTYNPIMQKSYPYKNKGRKARAVKHIGADVFLPSERTDTHLRYPNRLLYFFSEKNNYSTNESRAKNCILPTQKPIPLLQYLVKTYTNDGDLVLDNTMGVGTTNLACISLKRNSIGIEKEKKYYDVAVSRATEYFNIPKLFF